MNQLFADTANLDQIVKLNEMGAIQGVTTNPSIIAKEPKGSFDAIIQKLAEYCGAEKLSLSVEVFATEYNQIINQASSIFDKYISICPQLYNSLIILLTCFFNIDNSGTLENLKKQVNKIISEL